MTRGRHLTRAEIERIWTLVEHGCHDVFLIARQLDISVVTARDVIYRSCHELMPRLRRERLQQQIDEISDPH